MASLQQVSLVHNVAQGNGLTPLALHRRSMTVLMCSKDGTSFETYKRTQPQHAWSRSMIRYTIPASMQPVVVAVAIEALDCFLLIASSAAAGGKTLLVFLSLAGEEITVYGMNQALNATCADVDQSRKDLLLGMRGGYVHSFAVRKVAAVKKAPLHFQAIFRTKTRLSAEAGKLPMQIVSQDVSNVSLVLCAGGGITCLDTASLEQLWFVSNSMFLMEPTRIWADKFGCDFIVMCKSVEATTALDAAATAAATTAAGSGNSSIKELIEYWSPPSSHEMCEAGFFGRLVVPTNGVSVIGVSVETIGQQYGTLVMLCLSNGTVQMWRPVASERGLLMDCDLKLSGQLGSFGFNSSEWFLRAAADSAAESNSKLALSFGGVVAFAANPVSSESSISIVALSDMEVLTIAMHTPSELDSRCQQTLLDISFARLRAQEREAAMEMMEFSPAKDHLEHFRALGGPQFAARTKDSQPHQLAANAAVVASSYYDDVEDLLSHSTATPTPRQYPYASEFPFEDASPRNAPILPMSEMLSTESMDPLSRPLTSFSDETSRPNTNYLSSRVYNAFDRNATNMSIEKIDEDSLCSVQSGPSTEEVHQSLPSFGVVITDKSLTASGSLAGGKALGEGIVSINLVAAANIADVEATSSSNIATVATTTEIAPPTPTPPATATAGASKPTSGGSDFGFAEFGFGVVQANGSRMWVNGNERSIESSQQLLTVTIPGMTIPSFSNSPQKPPPTKQLNPAVSFYLPLQQVSGFSSSSFSSSAEANPLDASYLRIISPPSLLAINISTPVVAAAASATPATTATSLRANAVAVEEEEEQTHLLLVSRRGLEPVGNAFGKGINAMSSPTLEFSLCGVAQRTGVMALITTMNEGFLFDFRGAHAVAVGGKIQAPIRLELDIRQGVSATAILVADVSLTLPAPRAKMALERPERGEEMLGSYVLSFFGDSEGKLHYALVQGSIVIRAGSIRAHSSPIVSVLSTGDSTRPLWRVSSTFIGKTTQYLPTNCPGSAIISVASDGEVKVWQPVFTATKNSALRKEQVLNVCNFEWRMAGLFSSRTRSSSSLVNPSSTPASFSRPNSRPHSQGGTKARGGAGGQQQQHQPGFTSAIKACVDPTCMTLLVVSNDGTADQWPIPGLVDTGSGALSTCRDNLWTMRVHKAAIHDISVYVHQANTAVQEVFISPQDLLLQQQNPQTNPRSRVVATVRGPSSGTIGYTLDQMRRLAETSSLVTASRDLSVVVWKFDMSSVHAITGEPSATCYLHPTPCQRFAFSSIPSKGLCFSTSPKASVQVSTSTYAAAAKENAISTWRLNVLVNGAVLTASQCSRKEMFQVNEEVFAPKASRSSSVSGSMVATAPAPALSSTFSISTTSNVIERDHEMHIMLPTMCSVKRPLKLAEAVSKRPPKESGAFSWLILDFWNDQQMQEENIAPPVILEEGVDFDGIKHNFFPNGTAWSSAKDRERRLDKPPTYNEARLEIEPGATVAEDELAAFNETQDGRKRVYQGTVRLAISANEMQETLQKLNEAAAQGKKFGISDVVPPTLTATVPMSEFFAASAADLSPDGFMSMEERISWEASQQQNHSTFRASAENVMNDSIEFTSSILNKMMNIDVVMPEFAVDDTIDAALSPIAPRGDQPAHRTATLTTLTDNADDLGLGETEFIPSPLTHPASPTTHKKKKTQADIFAEGPKQTKAGLLRQKQQLKAKERLDAHAPKAAKVLYTSKSRGDLKPESTPGSLKQVYGKSVAFTPPVGFSAKQLELSLQRFVVDKGTSKARKNASSPTSGDNDNNEWTEADQKTIAVARAKTEKRFSTSNFSFATADPEVMAKAAAAAAEASASASGAVPAVADSAPETDALMQGDDKGEDVEGTGAITFNWNSPNIYVKRQTKSTHVVLHKHAAAEDSTIDDDGMSLLSNTMITLMDDEAKEGLKVLVNEFNDEELELFESLDDEFKILILKEIGEHCSDTSMIEDPDIDFDPLAKSLAAIKGINMMKRIAIRLKNNIKVKVGKKGSEMPSAELVVAITNMERTTITVTCCTGNTDARVVVLAMEKGNEEVPSGPDLERKTLPQLRLTCPQVTRIVGDRLNDDGSDIVLTLTHLKPSTTYTLYGYVACTASKRTFKYLSKEEMFDNRVDCTTLPELLDLEWTRLSEEQQFIEARAASRCFSVQVAAKSANVQVLTDDMFALMKNDSGSSEGRSVIRKWREFILWWAPADKESIGAARQEFLFQEVLYALQLPDSPILKAYKDLKVATDEEMKAMMEKIATVPADARSIVGTPLEGSPDVLKTFKLFRSWYKGGQVLEDFEEMQVKTFAAEAAAARAAGGGGGGEGRRGRGGDGGGGGGGLGDTDDTFMDARASFESAGGMSLMNDSLTEGVGELNSPVRMPLQMTDVISTVEEAGESTSQVLEGGEGVAAVTAVEAMVVVEQPEDFFVAFMPAVRIQERSDFLLERIATVDACCSLVNVLIENFKTAEKKKLSGKDLALRRATLSNEELDLIMASVKLYDLVNKRNILKAGKQLDLKLLGSGAFTPQNIAGADLFVDVLQTSLVAEPPPALIMTCLPGTTRRPLRAWQLCTEEEQNLELTLACSLDSILELAIMDGVSVPDPEDVDFRKDELKKLVPFRGRRWKDFATWYCGDEGINKVPGLGVPTLARVIFAEEWEAKSVDGDTFVVEAMNAKQIVVPESVMLRNAEREKAGADYVSQLSSEREAGIKEDIVAAYDSCLNKPEGLAIRLDLVRRYISAVIASRRSDMMRLLWPPGPARFGHQFMFPRLGMIIPKLELPSMRFKLFPSRIKTAYTHKEISKWYTDEQLDEDDVLMIQAEEYGRKRRAYLEWLSHEAERCEQSRILMLEEDRLGQVRRKYFADVEEALNRAVPADSKKNDFALVVPLSGEYGFVATTTQIYDFGNGLENEDELADIKEAQRLAFEEAARKEAEKKRMYEEMKLQREKEEQARLKREEQDRRLAEGVERRRLVREHLEDLKAKRAFAAAEQERQRLENQQKEELMRLLIEKEDRTTRAREMSLQKLLTDREQMVAEDLRMREYIIACSEVAQMEHEDIWSTVREMKDKRAAEEYRSKMAQLKEIYEPFVPFKFKKENVQLPALHSILASKPSTADAFEESFRSKYLMDTGFGSSSVSSLVAAVDSQVLALSKSQQQAQDDYFLDVLTASANGTGESAAAKMVPKPKSEQQDTFAIQSSALFGRRGVDVELELSEEDDLEVTGYLRTGEDNLLAESSMFSESGLSFGYNRQFNTRSVGALDEDELLESERSLGLLGVTMGRGTLPSPTVSKGKTKPGGSMSSSKGGVTSANSSPIRKRALEPFDQRPIIWRGLSNKLNAKIAEMQMQDKRPNTSAERARQLGQPVPLESYTLTDRSHRQAELLAIRRPHSASNPLRPSSMHSRGRGSLRPIDPTLSQVTSTSPKLIPPQPNEDSKLFASLSLALTRSESIEGYLSSLDAGNKTETGNNASDTQETGGGAIEPIETAAVLSPFDFDLSSSSLLASSSLQQQQNSQLQQSVNEQRRKLQAILSRSADVANAILQKHRIETVAMQRSLTVAALAAVDHYDSRGKPLRKHKGGSGNYHAELKKEATSSAILLSQEREAVREYVDGRAVTQDSFYLQTCEPGLRVSDSLEASRSVQAFMQELSMSSPTNAGRAGAVASSLALSNEGEAADGLGPLLTGLEMQANAKDSSKQGGKFKKKKKRGGGGGAEEVDSNSKVKISMEEKQKEAELLAFLQSQQRPTIPGASTSSVLASIAKGINLFGKPIDINSFHPTLVAKSALFRNPDGSARAVPYNYSHSAVTGGAALAMNDDSSTGTGRITVTSSAGGSTTGGTSIGGAAVRLLMRQHGGGSSKADSRHNSISSAAGGGGSRSGSGAGGGGTAEREDNLCLASVLDESKSDAGDFLTENKKREGGRGTASGAGGALEADERLSLTQSTTGAPPAGNEGGDGDAFNPDLNSVVSGGPVIIPGVPIKGEEEEAGEGGGEVKTKAGGKAKVKAGGGGGGGGGQLGDDLSDEEADDDNTVVTSPSFKVSVSTPSSKKGK